MNMVLRWVQNGLYGDRIARTPLDKPPVFVIGHWRTGTTLLHELLIQDPRFSYPDIFDCFDPNHSLLTRAVLQDATASGCCREQRPMDNMAAGWDRPQEDEFALCLLGLPIAVHRLRVPEPPAAVPRVARPVGAVARRNSRGGSGRSCASSQTLTFRDPRRLVLKSPPHTARVPVLLEMFPDARFVHIVRDPYVVFPSTVNLWKSLARTARPPDADAARGCEEKVFARVPGDLRPAGRGAAAVSSRAGSTSCGTRSW